MPSAPLREGLAAFVPLTAQDLVRLVNDREIRRLYIECLLYMHDAVCEAADNPTPRRITTPQDAKIDMGVTISRHFKGNDTLSRNVQLNWEHAEDLGTTALVQRGFYDVQAVRREVEAFISALLFTYNQVRLLD